MEVNQKQLSQYLGISTRRIRQLREDGVFQKRDNTVTGYNLEQCIQEYIEYKVNAETGRRTSASKEIVQAEHEEIKKQISVLKLRKLRRELHEAADVESYLSDMIIRFRNKLMNVPVRVAVRLIGETDVNRVTEILEKEMINTLNELSNYNPDEIDGLSGIESDYDEEDDDIE